MYRTIAHTGLRSLTHLYRPAHTLPGRISLKDPAGLVMTDFTRLIPFTIQPTSTIVEASGKMIACGVRLLFVSQEIDESILGLITATDILGEKPLKHLQEYGGLREHILVEEIMTPRELLEALHMKDVIHARVGDIVETLKQVGRQHVLVIDRTEDHTGEAIRGLFSASQISRQVGIGITPALRANTFAELGSALAAFN